MLSNRLITAGILVELGLILLIDYTREGNALIGTAPVPFTTWLFVIPFAAAMLCLEELRKCVVRRTNQSGLPQVRVA